MSANRGKAINLQHQHQHQHRERAERDDNPSVGSAVCTGCQAIYHNKHWHLPGHDNALKLGIGKVEETVCPGCTKVERQEYDGQVTISGPFLAAHQTEILGLIRNAEALLRSHNPIARIAKLTHEPDRIEVLTISPFLAERIGKELSKAYAGELTIQHPVQEQFVRVTWVRDD